MSIHSDARAFSCEFCGMSFKIRNSLRAHRRRMHTQDNMKKCPECTRIFFTENERSEHIAVSHRGERKFVCHICDRNYSRSFHLRRHYSDAHKDVYEEMLQRGEFRRTRRNIENAYYPQKRKATNDVDMKMEDENKMELSNYEVKGN